MVIPCDCQLTGCVVSIVGAPSRMSSLVFHHAHVVLDRAVNGPLSVERINMLAVGSANHGSVLTIEMHWQCGLNMCIDVALGGKCSAKLRRVVIDTKQIPMDSDVFPLDAPGGVASVAWSGYSPVTIGTVLAWIYADMKRFGTPLEVDSSVGIITAVAVGPSGSAASGTDVQRTYRHSFTAEDIRDYVQSSGAGQEGREAGEDRPGRAPGDGADRTRAVADHSD